MASQSYYAWVRAGRPYVLARPCRELQALLDAAGYTVYDYPDDAHLFAATPEDHTPFSATGWPTGSARWVGHALDIMPKAGLMSLPALARRIIAARDAKSPGTEWIKYLNWTDEQGHCWHERWAADGTRTTTTSTDKGHIHISARSDYDTSDVVSASGWTPLEDDMALSDTDGKALIYRMDSTANMQDVTRYGANGNPEPNLLVQALKRMEARQIVSAASEQAALAAITALAKSGGVDAAPILAAVDRVGADLGAKLAAQATEIDQLQAQLTAYRAAEAEAAQREAELLAAPVG